MSIAVSVVVKPSRLLIMMVGTMCAGTAFMGAMLGSGQIGDLPNVARFSLAVFSVFLAFFGFYHTVRHQKPLHIDISSAGQLRLMSLNDVAGSCQKKNWPHVKGKSEVVRLLPDSTIWPHLLLLRLQAENEKITILPVLPDCVSRDSFRALSVACRWIAAQNKPAEHKNL